MPTYNQYMMVKKQCEALESLGCKATIQIESMKRDAHVDITVRAKNLLYKIDNTDWNIIPFKLFQIYDLLRNVQHAERIRRIPTFGNTPIYASASGFN